MVFSFFKKNREKMVARPAAVPRPRAGNAADSTPSTPSTPSAPSTRSKEPGEPAAEAAKPAVPPPEAVLEDPSVIEFDNFADFDERVFSTSSQGFQVEQDLDPIDAKAEEAAVLFANAQDDAAHAVLEDAVREHRSGAGERLWFMLFDLYRVSGKKAAFEALGIDYAKAFEKSPPGWRDRSKAKPKSREVAASNLLFSGELTGDNDGAFEAIRRSLAKNPRLRLDMSRVERLDIGGCSRLLAALRQARKSKCELELLGREALSALAEKQLEPGRPDAEPCWLLLLELCQLQGRPEAFDEVAINYAITFEVSPPSWESARVAAPEPQRTAASERAPAEQSDDAYVLRDEIKSARFPDLSAFADVHDPLVIDCEALNRIDFISAGALLNALTIIRRNGRQIVFRHPNHLVAELFGVVGLKAVASIVFARN